ncbi:MAG: phytanoyl-CoA dioxygenase family protein [Planctomycetota bacterium]
MSDQPILLNSKQMAEFAARGFIRLDEIVPRDRCEAAIEYMRANQHHDWKQGNGKPFDEIFPADSLMGGIFRLPKFRGAIESLVGPHPRYDHHFPHRVGPNTHVGANLHQDSEIDTRTRAFDIQFSFFPDDTPVEMGGTLFVPGSQFRQVHESQLSRYQNIVGQVQAVCKAGTVFFWHHNIWHSARSNHTPRERFMFKVRLNPTVPQVRLWDTADLDDPAVQKTLFKPVPWHGQEGRIEEIQRIKFWRYLTGNPTYDHALWLGRLENDPQPAAAVQA